MSCLWEARIIAGFLFTLNAMAQSYIKRILNAQVYDVARETLWILPLLSARLGNHALLKREDLQPVFSFKCRGAYNKMIHLDSVPGSRRCGCIGR